MNPFTLRLHRRHQRTQPDGNPIVHFCVGERWKCVDFSRSIVVWRCRLLPEPCRSSVSVGNALIFHGRSLSGVVDRCPSLGIVGSRWLSLAIFRNLWQWPAKNLSANFPACDRAVGSKASWAACAQVARSALLANRSGVLAGKSLGPLCQQDMSGQPGG